MSNAIFRRTSHPLEGATCPVCNIKFSFCEIAECDRLAEYEGWVSSGAMLQRRRLCKEHSILTVAYKNKGDKCFEEKEQKEQPLRNKSV